MRVVTLGSLVLSALALLAHASCTSPGGGGGGAGIYPDGWVAPDTGGVYVPPAQGPPLQAQQYCDQFGQAACAGGLACGCLDFVGGDVALCEAYLGAECKAEVIDPVAAGSMAINAAYAGQCVAAVKIIVADCDVDDADVALYLASHCEDFLTGLGTTGDPCEDDSYCLDGLECFGDECVVMPTDGQPCLDGASCADDHYCDEQDLCRPLIGPGQSCQQASYACQDALYCDERVYTCQPLLSQGDDCGHAGYACRDDLYCDSRDDTCQPYLAAGQSCEHASHACRDDLYCDSRDDTCRPYATSGQSCAHAEWACADDLYCGADQLCHPEKAAGSPCAADRECISYDCVEGICVADDEEMCPFF